VSQDTGATVRQLQYWRRVGIVRPSCQTAGGHWRYTDADVRRVRLLLLLAGGERRPGGDRPISARRAAQVIDRLASTVEAWLSLASGTAPEPDTDARLDTRT
jgi:hypothetical protein